MQCMKYRPAQERGCLSNDAFGPLSIFTRAKESGPNVRFPGKQAGEAPCVLWPEALRSSQLPHWEMMQSPGEKTAGTPDLLHSRWGNCGYKRRVFFCWFSTNLTVSVTLPIDCGAVARDWSTTPYPPA